MNGHRDAPPPAVAALFAHLSRDGWDVRDGVVRRPATSPTRTAGGPVGAFGALLRDLHETSADLDAHRDAATAWADGPRMLGLGEVVRHGALRPGALVWDGPAGIGDVVGLRGWELASPGPDMADLVHTAVWICGWRPPPTDRDDDLHVRGALGRIGAFVSGYGDVTVADVVECVPDVLAEDLTRARERPDVMPIWPADAIRAVLRWHHVAARAILAPTR